MPETKPALTDDDRRRKGFSVIRTPQPRQTAPIATSAAHRQADVLEVALERVLPDPQQPRHDWDHDEGERRLAELTDSVREFGIIQPLLVREGDILPDGGQTYIVIAGGRRLAAAERAGLGTVPIIVRSDEGIRVRLLQLSENIQRQNLSPLDEARAFQELIEMGGFTPPQLAERLGVSPQLIRERLRLLTDQIIADALQRGQLSMSAARTLQQLPDDSIALFRARLQRGEQVVHNEIVAERQRLHASGIINPRYKGGGGRRASTSSVEPAEHAVRVPMSTKETFGSGGDTVADGQHAVRVPDATEPANTSPIAHSSQEPERTKSADTAVEAALAAGVAEHGRLAGDIQQAGHHEPEHHPAVTSVFLREFAAWLDRALGAAPRERSRLSALFRQLEDGADPASWWPDLYPLVRAILLRNEQ